MQEFCQKLHREISGKLGDTVTVELKEIIKNNGVRFHGLVFSGENGNIAPTIYLEGYYPEYRNGKALSEIREEILQLYEGVKNRQQIDIRFFENYDVVQTGICFKLINRARNEELLKRVPSIPYLDLAIVFFYYYRNELLGDGTILIHNSHMKAWGVTVTELYERALYNTERLFAPELLRMEQLLKEELLEEIHLQEEIQLQEEKQQTQRTGIWEEEKDMEGQESVAGSMLVLTNRQRQYGAASILYTQYLQLLAVKLNRNFFILPSSVHEVILLPDCGLEREPLKQMVEEVNETQVAAEEVLSDSVYYYDREKKAVQVIL